MRAHESSFCFSPTDLAHCHAYLVEMSQLLQSMDVLHRTYSAPAINAIQVSQLPLLFAPQCFPASLSPPQPRTNSGTLSGLGCFSHIQGDGGGHFAVQFSLIGLVGLTLCALFPVLKQRVELLKVPKRKKDPTGGGGPELLAKMLKERCR